MPSGVPADIRISDAHVHFFSHRFLEILAAQAGLDAHSGVAEKLPDWDLPPPEPEALADLWIDELDRCQVDYAGLMASIPGDESSVLAAVRKYPSRFVGYFMFNPVAPNRVEVLRQALDGGLRCVALFPAMHGYELSDPRVEDTVRIVAGYPGAAVFVHCGLLSVGIRKRFGLTSEYDLRLSNPVNMHALAVRYPTVPFIIPHFGAGYFREALMVTSSSKNIYLDTSSSNKWMALEGLSLKEVFARALAVVGAGRLLFGTDSSFFPRGWNGSIFDQQMAVIKELSVSESDAQRIFRQNFCEIFQLP